MPEMLDGVVPVLVECPEQFLETLLDHVGVGVGGLVQTLCVAVHRYLLLLVDPRYHSLKQKKITLFKGTFTWDDFKK